MQPTTRPIARRGDATFGAWLGVALLLIYVCMLLLPPAGSSLAVPTPAAGWLERLYPGVPSYWSSLRLLAWGLGIFLVARRLAATPPPLPACHLGPRTAPARFAVGLAAASACLLVLAATRVRDATPSLQILYLAALPLPCLTLWCGTRSRSSLTLAQRLAPALPTLFVILVWSGTSLASAIASPRTASTVDTWLGSIFMHQVVTNELSLFHHNFVPGMPDYYLAMQGAAYGIWTGTTPNFALLQTFQVLWSAVAAALTAGLAAQLVQQRVAPVAAAVLLFSPYMLAMPYFASPWPLAIALGLALLAGCIHFYRWRSPASYVAIATIAGFALPLLWTTPAAILAVGVLVRWAWQRQVDAAVVIVAVLCGFSGAYPGAPESYMYARMVNEFAERRTQISSMQAIMFGQRSVLEAPGFDAIEKTAGKPGPIDIPVGVLLAPSAVARTPVRLWGDNLLEGVGATLGGIGLLLCLHAPTSGIAPLLLVALGFALGTGMTSSYDVPALGRIPLLPAAIALHAAFAASVIAHRVPRLTPRVWTLAAMAGGLLLFHGVAPRVLPTSALELIGEQLVAPGWRSRAHVLISGTRPGLASLEGEWILRQFVGKPVPNSVLVQPLSSGDLGARIGAGVDILFWSPATEKDFEVAVAVCREWPAARLRVLFDRPHQSRVFAAHLTPGTWQPAGADDRSQQLACDDAGLRAIHQAAQNGQPSS